MKLTEDDALQLASCFREVAIQLGDRLEEIWSSLDPSERQELQNEEFTLLNAASQMRTKAIGILLAEEELSFARLQGAAKKAKTAIKKIKKASQIIELAAGVVGLASAILSMDPGAIFRNAKALYDAASTLIA